MELVNILSKVVKENLTTKKILLEYPESTVKKLLDKFTKETDETEDEIRKTISDFERFKSGLDNADKDIFKHSYQKLKSLITSKSTQQKTKKDLDGLVQDYIAKNKGADLQLTKNNIKKFFEIKTNLPQAREFKSDVTNINPSELNSLVQRYFTKFNNQGVNELIVAIAQKFHDENPDEDVMTAILPRVKRFVKHYDLIPLNAKLSKLMNFIEFEHIVDGYTPMEESEYTVPEVDTSDVDIAYEDDDILIFAPDQKHKCINIRKKFAPDRRWCTSWEGSSNYYYNYRLNQNLTLYYVIQKNLPETDLNYATVVLVDKYGGMRLADGSNSGRYAGGNELPWSEIVSKVPALEGKKDYLEAKPYDSEDEAKLKKYKSYNLNTTDPISELGSLEEVELWLELRSPDLKSTPRGDEIFGNFPEELQKKYIGLGNELSAGMVRALTPSAMGYYISKKREKLLQKTLKDLNENDMEIILSKEMRPYYKSLKEKFSNELNNQFGDIIQIKYPSDTSAKYIRMFGMNELLDSIPDTTILFEVDNTSNDKVIFDIPDSIGKLTNLQTLVFNNCINKLPETVGNLTNLQFLTLTNNEELTTFPNSVVDLRCLLFISVENSPIDIETLPEEFKRYVDTSADTFWPVNYPDEMKGDCLL
jgi:hypothetical protein